MRTLLGAVLLSVATGPCSSGWLPNVCVNVTSTPANQPNKPDLPEQWRAKVECKILAKNMTVIVEQYYDYSENRARARQLSNLVEGDVYYDYTNDEILTLNRYGDAGSCQVLDMDQDPNKFLYGVKRDPTGRHHVLSPSGALHFGDDFNWVFHGTHETVRGIIAEGWSSCQYSPILDATMSVAWYFSVKTEWDMQLGVRSVPLRAIVIGQLNDPVAQRVRAFHNIYDIFDFEPSISPRDFQLQPGDYCPGRVTTKPFPSLPSKFSIIGEILDNDQDVMKTQETYYDSERKLNVYKYKSADSLGLLVGAAQRTEINDFNEGYAYMIDNTAGTCRVGLIEDGNFAYVDVKASVVRQQNPAEFFLSTNVSWEYGGTKAVRGVQCDTWVGMSSSMQGYENQVVRIEWAFATSDYNDWNTGVANVPIPVSCRIWRSGSTGVKQVNYEYNAYAFTEYDQPFYSIIDVSPCFRGSERVSARFGLSNDYLAAVVNNLQAFKTALTEAVRLTVGISPLRVADILVERAASAMMVSFNLLDKPAFAGDTDGLTENSLGAAVMLLTSPYMANSFNNFPISVVLNDNVMTLRPTNNTGHLIFSNGTCLGFCSQYSQSFSPQQPSTAGKYSGGSLAGLGIAMVIIGGASGASGGYYMFIGRKKL